MLLPYVRTSQQDGSNKKSQHNVFIQKYGKLSLNYSCYHFYLEDCTKYCYTVSEPTKPVKIIYARKGPQIKPNRMKVKGDIPSNEELLAIKQKKRVS